MPITPLQLPDAIRQPQIDWSPLSQLGDAFAANARRQKIAETLASNTGPGGALDIDRAGASLARLGLLDEARPFLALAQQKAHLAQSAAGQAEAARHNRAMEGIAQAAEARQAETPVTIPFGSGVMTRSGKVIREPGLGETGTFDEPTLKQLAEQARAGDASVFTNLGRGAQGAANVIALRKKIAEMNAAEGAGGADQAARNAEYFGTKAGERTLGTRTANIEMATVEAQKVAPLALEASSNVPRTNYPTLNAALLAWEKGSGDENVVRLGVAVNSLINIYSRAISPSGVPTVSDKMHARDLLDASWSKGQFAAGVDQLMRELAAARESPGAVRKQMREAITGRETETKPAASAGPTVGATATNPKTGQRIRWNGKVWEPI